MAKLQLTVVVVALVVFFMGFSSSVWFCGTLTNVGFLMLKTGFEQSDKIE